MLLCLIMCIVFNLPALVNLILNPTKRMLTICFASISMTFFMYSYHVHEKSILLPLLMTPFLAEYYGTQIVVDLIIAGCAGMFHLLKEDHQQIGYFILLSLYFMFSYEYIQITEKIDSLQNKEESKVIKLHKKWYNNKYRTIAFYLIFVILHIL
jgi:hypothetical protein